MSIPELDKIMKLSNLFGVSTDYLLKDELEAMTPSEAPAPDEEALRTVDMDEANAYMTLVERCAPVIAAAVSLFILCPIPTILLSGLSEYRGLLSEDAAAAIGVTILLVCIVIGVVPLILKCMELNKYEYLEKEPFTLQYGVKGLVEKKQGDYEHTFRTAIAMGVALCILGVIPLILFGGWSQDDFVATCTVCALLVLVSIGVNFFVRAGMIWDSYQTLLQLGDHTPENKQAEKKLEVFPAIYWCSVTALFLFLGFRPGGWETAWVVWPVAGVLFVAVMGILKMLVMGKK